LARSKHIIYKKKLYKTLAFFRFTPQEADADKEKRRYQAKIQAQAKKELEKERQVGRGDGIRTNPNVYFIWRLVALSNY
jgi:DNA-binding helix-hairpin-helix protein with protein kinase domain